jgi:hypothetical protein
MKLARAAPLRSPFHAGSAALRLGIAIAWAGLAATGPAIADDAVQRNFATAQQAVDALVTAMRNNDPGEAVRILGPDGDELVRSGDEVADREGRARFLKAYDAAHRIDVQGGRGAKGDAASATLVIGPERWPMPIPIVKQDGRWHFDAAASAQKIIDRRIGRNELNVIEVCRAYVSAQREYASKDRLGNGLHEYARRFHSIEGQHDGLYWDAAAGQEQSPLGPLIASAQAEGYEGEQHTLYRTPYHGYYYRILTEQGEHAPGGAKDYVVNGHMTGGFALIAFPARWGDSGIMTFIVNKDGIVFQKNLGPDTEQLARQISEYDPDSSWTTP